MAPPGDRSFGVCPLVGRLRGSHGSAVGSAWCQGLRREVLRLGAEGVGGRILWDSRNLWALRGRGGVVPGCIWVSLVALAWESGG